VTAQRQAEVKKEQAQSNELSVKRAKAKKEAEELNTQVEQDLDPEAQAKSDIERQKAGDEAAAHTKNVEQKIKQAAADEKAEQEEMRKQTRKLRMANEELAAELIGAQTTSQTLLERIDQIRSKSGKEKYKKKEAAAKDRVKELGAKKKANEEELEALRKRSEDQAAGLKNELANLEVEKKASMAEEAAARNSDTGGNSKRLHQAERNAKEKVKEIGQKQEQVAEQKRVSKQHFERKRNAAVQELHLAKGKTPTFEHPPPFRHGGHLHVKEAYPYNKQYDLTKTGRALRKWCTTQNGLVPCEELGEVSQR